MAQERTTSLKSYTVLTTELRDAERVGTASADEEWTYALPVHELPQAYRIAKRALDVIVSATALVLLSPLLALAVVLIRLTSSGPAFFRQQRVGEGGRIFTIYKFRSMYDNVDHTLHQIAYVQFISGNGGDGKVGREALMAAGVAVADEDNFPHAGHIPAVLAWGRRRARKVWARIRPDDPRITPLGALLRLTSIDELPQLYNVLCGDMSLVGPRPPIPYEVRLYSQKHLQRLSVQPGLTGIWQVYGRNRVPFEKMVDMDLHYIQQRSFWLDLKLIALTVPSMLAARGAK